MKNYTVLVLCSFFIASHTMHASIQNKNDLAENGPLEFAGYSFQASSPIILKQSSPYDLAKANSSETTESPNRLSNIFAQYAKTSDSSKNKNEPKFSSLAVIDYEDRFPNCYPQTKITVDDSGKHIKINGVAITDVSPYDGSK